MPNFYTFHDEVWAPVADSRPALYYFFEGYMDAAKVGEGLADYLLEHSNPQVLATFDVDVMHDYRARRPRMIFDTDSFKSVDEIAMTLYLCRDLTNTPFLVLKGPEPDMAWNRLRDAIIELLDRMDVWLAFNAQGFPMAVPHTRPTPLTTHSTHIELRGTNPRWIDRIELPASFSSYLEFALGQSGRRAMGIAAHVPHYLAQGTYLEPTRLILERFAKVTGLNLPLDEMRERAQANLEVIAAETAENTEAAEMLTMLESQFDAFSAAADAQLPSADELGAAFEQFLAEQGKDDWPS